MNLHATWKCAIFVVSLTVASTANAGDEVTLFDGTGKPVAYIALDGEMTIYLWGGKPVAYLDRDTSGGYHVYGFNGKHLGWFVRGVIWGQDGKASCAVKEVLASTAYEPYKSYKQYKPYKSYKQYAPYRPYFRNSFGDTPCRFLLGEGGK
jgi:hypothetical protein